MVTVAVANDSSFGSMTVTTSGNGSFGPILPVGSWGSIILTFYEAEKIKEGKRVSDYPREKGKNMNGKLVLNPYDSKNTNKKNENRQIKHQTLAKTTVREASNSLTRITKS
jgi:hypothetical protein